MLLPPSEGKARPRRGRPLDLDTLGFADRLTPAREAVLDALVSVSHSPDAARVLGLTAGLADWLDVDRALRTAPTARAEAIYTGVLYDALGLDSLSLSGRRRVSRRVLVTSSLFGVVRAADRIPAYRLSGDVALPGLGPVAAHWRRHLGPALHEAVGSGLLVDLRSGQYAAFWRPDLPRVATLRVLHERAGVRTVVSHFNKATKGRIVRALLESGADPRTPAGLADALGDLGWRVELGPEVPAGRPRGLDVVVDEI